MGGRGASSSTGKTVGRMTAVLGMTDAQLSKAINKANEQMKRSGEQLEALAHKIEEASWSPRKGRAKREDAARRAYYDELDSYNALRKQLDALKNESARRSQAARPPINKKFVNSYGEATSRYITTATYERARRKTESQAGTWLTVR